jgi:hypothetical protein
MRISSMFDFRKTHALTLWKMNLIFWPLMGLGLVSCGSSGLPNASSANASSLYDPPTVSLIEGKAYEFKEGILVGRKDHKFHSDYSYRRAIIIGDK